MNLVNQTDIQQREERGEEREDIKREERSEKREEKLKKRVESTEKREEIEREETDRGERVKKLHYYTIYASWR